jgi:hypothetical protein
MAKYLNYDGLKYFYAKIKALLNTKSDATHTHNYAGASSPGGAATTSLACTGNAATATNADRAGYADESFYADYSGQSDYTEYAEQSFQAEFSIYSEYATNAEKVNAVTGSVQSITGQTTYVILGFRPSFVMIFMENKMLNCLKDSDIYAPDSYSYLPRILFKPLEGYPNETGITETGFQFMNLAQGRWGSLSYEFVAFR